MTGIGESTEPHIIIPTHGRAGLMRTHHLVPNIAKFCVAESQYPLYKAEYPHLNYVIHPDSVKGLAAKRQWIYDKFQDVFMMDDDMARIMDMGADTLANEGKPRQLSENRVLGIIEQSRDTALQMGIYLYGFLDTLDPIMYNVFDPFLFTGFVKGSNMGILPGSKLWFNPDIVSNEDVWISCLNMHHHRIMFINQRYGFSIIDTGRNPGGQSERRTTATLAKDKEILLQAFGSNVIIEKKKRKNFGVFNEHQINIRKPW